MNLWEIKAKHQAHIDSLCESLSPTISGRLSEMGFTPGQSLICLRRTPMQGPLVIQLGDCVYSLEREVASKIHLSLAM